jgi:hypothetical protein
MASLERGGPRSRQAQKRRQLSCLPCRQHKLKCDRQVPCQTCIRYLRTQRCGQHPAPEERLLFTPAPVTRPAQASTHLVHDGPTPHENTRGEASIETSSPSAHGTVATVARGQCIRLRRTANSIPFQEGHSIGENTLLVSDAVGTFTHQLPVMPVLLSLPLTQPPQSFSVQSRPKVLETKGFWKAQLVALLPTRNQCDMLVTFYMENLNLIYRVIHEPSFRQQYHHFWSLQHDQVDLIWLSLLLSILCLGSMYMPIELAEAISLDGETVRHLSHVWHSASRQALYSGGFESRPRELQLTVFVINQMYWSATNEGETLNSCLGQAVRNAQALRFDRDTPGSNTLAIEMRRRVWWELWVCDTFQALCYGRTPLIQTRPDRVPLMANCNDARLTESSIVIQPLNEPTDTSAHVVRAEVFKILHSVYANDRDQMHSWGNMSGR